jgi:hypothetical protein
MIGLLGFLCKVENVDDLQVVVVLSELSEKQKGKILSGFNSPEVFLDVVLVDRDLHLQPWSNWKERARGVSTVEDLTFQPLVQHEDQIKKH